MPFQHVHQVAEADFPTRWGHFRILGFVGEQTLKPVPSTATPVATPQREEMVALVMGDLACAPPLVRIHSQCLTGDVFASLRCDCRQQLELSLGAIAEQGAGVLLYEQQEGRGIGLMPKLKAYALQDRGFDTVEANEQLGFQADYRAFELPAAVLRLLGIGQVRLMTNNPDKVAALEASGIRVVERVSAAVKPEKSFERYLQVKHDKMGHLCDEPVSDVLKAVNPASEPTKP